MTVTSTLFVAVVTVDCLVRCTSTPTDPRRARYAAGATGDTATDSQSMRRHVGSQSIGGGTGHPTQPTDWRRRRVLVGRREGLSARGRPTGISLRSSVRSSQPQYPIDRIKSLAGDVIVFGVRPLIILCTRLPRTRSLPDRRLSFAMCVCRGVARRAVALYRLPAAPLGGGGGQRRRSLSVRLSVGVRRLLQLPWYAAAG